MRCLTPAIAALFLLSSPIQAQDGEEIFVLKTTNKSPEAVVQAIKAHSDKMNWRYVGDSKVKKGQVTLVKICIPAVGREVWPAGLKISAMLPCGNLGIYRKGDETEISMLHPNYMYTLYPIPETRKAGEIALPLLTDMLNSIAE